MTPNAPEISTIPYRLNSTFQSAAAHQPSLGRAGKEIATVGTGSAWPSEFSFNLIDRAKIAVVRDACEHRRVCGGNRQCPLSEHYSKLLGMVGPDESMLFAKIQDLRQCFN